MIIVYTGKRHVRYGTLPIEAWVMDENGHVLQPPRQVDRIVRKKATTRTSWAGLSTRRVKCYNQPPEQIFWDCSREKACS